MATVNLADIDLGDLETLKFHPLVIKDARSLLWEYWLPEHELVHDFDPDTMPIEDVWHNINRVYQDEDGWTEFIHEFLECPPKGFL